MTIPESRKPQKPSSVAQKKFVAFLQKKDPTLSDKDIDLLLVSTKRFVTVAQKIYKEPQAQIIYKDRKDEKGKIIKQRIIKTDLTEFKKVLEDSEESSDLVSTFIKFNKAILKDKK